MKYISVISLMDQALGRINLFWQMHTHTSMHAGTHTHTRHVCTQRDVYALAQLHIRTHTHYMHTCTHTQVAVVCFCCYLLVSSILIHLFSELIFKNPSTLILTDEVTSDRPTPMYPHVHSRVVRQLKYT